MISVSFVKETDDSNVKLRSRQQRVDDENEAQRISVISNLRVFVEGSACVCESAGRLTVVY